MRANKMKPRPTTGTSSLTWSIILSNRESHIETSSREMVETTEPPTMMLQTERVREIGLQVPKTSLRVILQEMKARLTLSCLNNRSRKRVDVANPAAVVTGSEVLYLLIRRD